MRLLRLAAAAAIWGTMAFIIVPAALGAAHAQTLSERQACRPDVFRLCAAADIARAAWGDRAGIYACFARNRHALSPACDRVLTRHKH